MASFWERVLPAEGPYTLMTGVYVGTKLTEVRHYNGLQTRAEVDKEVTRLSMLPLNVNYGVGSFASANRKDPIAKRCWYLDLDPKEFGDKDNALRQLGVFMRVTGLPPASILVDSGNGWHVYWCVEEDVPVAHWLVVAKALKAKCDELEFPADPLVTTDASHPLRAPGSLNRKGDMPMPCRVVVDNPTTYTLGDIAKQLEVAPVLPSIISTLKGLVDNNDLVTKRDYDNKNPAEVREMLGHIQLPPSGGGMCRDLWIRVLLAVQDWSEKSEHGFEIFSDWSATQPGFVSVEDCRATWDSFEPGGGITIGSLIKIARDAGWGQAPAKPALDASFAETVAAASTGAGADSNLPNVQSVQRASPLLAAAHHAVELGGLPRFELVTAVDFLKDEFILVMDHEGMFFSVTEREALAKSVIDDMLTRYMPWGSRRRPLNPSAVLRDFGITRSVNNLGFYPGQPLIYTEDDRAYVNLYTSPAPLLTPTTYEAEMFNDLWDYVFPNEDDQEFAEYLLGFYGHLVQHPSVKITSAPVMISEKTGTGKTTMMYDVPRALVGHANSRMVSNKVLRSQFSDFISGAHLVHFDEIHINGKWDSDDTANAMKNLVTGDIVEVHPKGLKPYNIRNRLVITATSNYTSAISLPRYDERRWGIYYLKPERGYTDEQQRLYYQRFARWVRGPRGPGVLRYIFSRVDLSRFNPNAPPPETKAKRDMVDQSQCTEVQVIMDAVRDEDGPFSAEVWTLEQVGQWLHAQMGKNYPGRSIKGFIEKAIPEARVVKEIRHLGDKGKIRVMAHTNFERWEGAPAEEVRDALKRF